MSGVFFVNTYYVRWYEHVAIHADMWIWGVCACYYLLLYATLILLKHFFMYCLDL